MDVIVVRLEDTLRQHYNFRGTLKDTTFNCSSEEAFQQLYNLLKPKDHIVPKTGESAPSVGDLAYVYWYGYGWFTAHIEQWLPEELSFLIRWTDGNWAPERAKYTNLCVDKVPDGETIGVGSKVLFQQGLYYCGYNDDGTVCDSTGRSLSEEKIEEIRAKGQISDRWHMGIITEIINIGEGGETLYNGKHVDESDPQYTGGNYMDFNSTFEGLRLDQLRTLPNIYNCLDTPDDDEGDNSSAGECDVFVSQVDNSDDFIRSIIRHISGMCNVSKSADNNGAPSSSSSLQKTVKDIKNCKVYCVCLTDNFIVNEQAMSELLYATKTLRKTIVPLVIGTSNKWAQTTAGMLLAGQLYIQFAGEDSFDDKIAELNSNLKKLVITDPDFTPAEKQSNKPQPRVFISYCWTNSKTSFNLGQVGRHTGNSFADPRKIKADIEVAIGEKVWLDVEQLNSIDDAGMFGQIAQGLSACSLVVMCVSKEYSYSANCQMEANFALRSLRKDTIVLEVGSGSDEDRREWVTSSVGMVLPTEPAPCVMTEDEVDDEEKYNEKMSHICERIRSKLEVEPHEVDVADDNAESSLRASVPMVGDAVIAHYAAWQFFPAKVASFDKSTLKYTVDWDDPDPACRVQPYDLVAVNRTPSENGIGVGTNVLFKQGVYGYNGSTGDVWNLGEITSITDGSDGKKMYSGCHSKSAEDGLAVASWPSYSPTFEDVLCEDLRLFPNAIEMLQAYK